MLRPRSLVVAFVITFAMLLTACVQGSDRESGPEPDPTPTLLFDTEEEALAAAEEAYERYLAASDAVSQDGGQGRERLTPLLSTDLAESESQFADELVAQGFRQTGATFAENYELRDLAVSRGLVRVEVSLCLDVSRTRFLSADGSDVTPLNRSERVALLVEFSGARDRLTLERSDQWKDSSPCS